jgi:hypothetical protein
VASGHPAGYNAANRKTRIALGTRPVTVEATIVAQPTVSVGFQSGFSSNSQLCPFGGFVMRRAVLFVSAMALLIVSGGFLVSQPPVKDRKGAHDSHRQVLSTMRFEIKKGPVDANVNPNPSYVYFTNHSLDSDPVYGSAGKQSKMNNFASFRFTVVADKDGPTLKAGSGMYHSDEKGVCHEFSKYLGIMRAAPPGDAPYYVFEEKNDSKIRWAFEATPDDAEFCTIFCQRGPTAPIELFQVAIRRPLVDQ